jgi:hypothetical protein
MAEALAVELAECFDIVECHGQLAERLVLRIDRFDAAEIQERIE